tara:strand:+ start:2421 stop:3722 length:1302 start_codon:yes stop_codon:yes gene_type:complete
MVFGWSKKKKDNTGKSIISPEQNISKSITLDEIPDILDNIVTLRKKTLTAEIKSHRNRIDPERELLLKIANEFQNDNLNTDDLDPHLQIIVNRGKKEIVSSIKNELNNPFPEVNSFDDAIRFKKISSTRIKTVGTMLGKHSRAIHILASKYAKKIKDDLEDLTDNLTHVDELIENFSDTENYINEISELLTTRENTLDNIIKLNNRKKELLITKEEKSKNILELKNTIEKIKQSSEYLSYIDVKSEFDEFNSKKDQIRRRINDEFTKVSRPLGKFIHISSHDKELKQLTQDLSSSPFDILNSENLVNIKSVFDAVMIGIDNGSVSVKDVSKAKQSIMEVKEMLPSLISEKEAFDSKKLSLQEKLENFDHSSLHNAESDLEHEENDISDVLSKTKSIDEEILELTQNLPKLLVQVETFLKNVTATSYTITVDTK